MDGSSWFLVVLVTVGVGTAAGITYYFLTMDKRLRKKSEGWTETTATIQAAEVEVSQGNSRAPAVFSAKLTYSYKVANAPYIGEGSFNISSKESKAVAALSGQTLPLRYDPDDVTSIAIFDADIRKLCKSLLQAKR